MSQCIKQHASGHTARRATRDAKTQEQAKRHCAWTEQAMSSELRRQSWLAPHRAAQGSQSQPHACSQNASRECIGSAQQRDALSRARRFAQSWAVTIPETQLDSTPLASEMRPPASEIIRDVLCAVENNRAAPRSVRHRPASVPLSNRSLCLQSRAWLARPITVSLASLTVSPATSRGPQRACDRAEWAELRRLCRPRLGCEPPRRLRCEHPRRLR